MEERVAEFQTQAEGKLPPEKLAKEIATLRRFLYKNQNHRFTEREKSKLMTALSAHWSNQTAHVTLTPSGEALIYGLLDDALKMPFTVFSTAQKQQMLKWFFSLQEKSDGKKGTSAAKLIELPCVDVTVEGYASLLLDDGSGTRDDVLVPESERQALSDAIGRGEDASVTIDSASGAFVSWTTKPS